VVPQELGLVLHSFYVQLLSTNFASSINWEVWPKVKLSVWLAFSLIKAEYGPNREKTWFSRAESSIWLFLYI